jgi:hypothetical protein
VTSDLLEDLTSMKDEWKSVSMRLGAPFVMAPGQPMMPMLLVGNWDMLPQVLLGKISNPVMLPLFSTFRSDGLH